MKIKLLSNIFESAPRIILFLLFLVVFSFVGSKSVLAADQWCAGSSPGADCLYNGQFYGGPNTTDPNTCEVTNRIWTCSASLTCTVPGRVDPHGKDANCTVCPAHGGNYKLTCSGGQWTESYDNGTCGTQTTNLDFCAEGCGTDYTNDRCAKPKPTATPVPAAPTATPVPTATPIPSPQPTSTPVPPGPSCPDGYCDAGGGETCSSCPSDCGACQQPTPTPTTGLVCDSPCNPNDNKCPTQGCSACRPNGSGQNTCQPPVGQPTPTPTTPLVCDSPCNPNDNKCPTQGCSACRPNGSGQNTCQLPVATPTPTTPVACNSDCSANPSICQQAGGGCTYCNPTNKKCEVPPACNTDCSANPDVCQQAGGGCTYCNPSNKKCEARPTPTPTPPFDESMCACDGISNGPLALGETTNITAWGKVMGVNKNYATIPSMRFKFLSGNSATDQKEVKVEKINTTVVLDTAEQVRYQAVWPLTLDSNLDTHTTYRIQAKIECVKKAAYAPNTSTSVVLAATTQKGFFGQMFDFFSRLFSIGGSSKNPTSVLPTAAPQPTNPNKKNLQLQTFRPATDVEYPKDADNCTFIKFNF